MSGITEKSSRAYEEKQCQTIRSQGGFLAKRDEKLYPRIAAQRITRVTAARWIPMEQATIVASIDSTGFMETVVAEDFMETDDGGFAGQSNATDNLVDTYTRRFCHEKNHLTERKIRLCD